MKYLCLIVTHITGTRSDVGDYSNPNIWYVYWTLWNAAFKQAILFLYETLVHEDLHFFKDLFNLLKLDTSVCVEALKVPNYNIE